MSPQHETQRMKRQQALAALNQTRRALAAASRSLYRHSEEQP